MSTRVTWNKDTGKGGVGGNVRLNSTWVYTAATTSKLTLPARYHDTGRFAQKLHTLEVTHTRDDHVNTRLRLQRYLEPANIDFCTSVRQLGNGIPPDQARPDKALGPNSMKGQWFGT
jgi:hypothetical protein